jgi:iron(III) transport system substrate-binding protein
VQEVNSRSIILWLVSAGVLLFVSCSQSGRTKKLVVYSPHGKEMLTEFENRYERLHPDVDVQWIDMGSQDVYDRIRTEKENPQADLWWGGPSTMFLRAEKEGLLDPYTPSWDTAVDAKYKSKNGYWYGTFVTPEVIAFNTHLLKKEDAPQDWDSLLDKKWRDKILLRYPLASGTMRGVFSSIIARSYERTGRPDDGYAWLLRLDANTKSYTADPTQLYLRLAREEGEVTIWDMPDIVIQVNQNGYPFGYVIPISGTVVLTEGIAIVKGSKNEEGARSFYEFVTSKESMILQANKFYRIPTRRDLDQAALPTWITQEKITAMDVDWSLVLDHEQGWMSYWDENIKGRGRDYVEAVGSQAK